MESDLVEDRSHQGLEGSRNYTARLQPSWQLVWQNHREGKKLPPKQTVTVVRKARRLPRQLSNISSGGGSAPASHGLLGWGPAPDGHVGKRKGEMDLSNNCQSKSPWLTFQEVITALQVGRVV